MIPTQSITDTDFEDDIALLANTLIQTEYLLQAAVCTGLCVNANKTEYTFFFYQKGDISTLNGVSLKLVDKFTYRGNSVSSSENDINMTVIHRQSIIWSQTYPIK